jgi:hypothetical protein
MINDRMVASLHADGGILVIYNARLAPEAIAVTTSLDNPTIDTNQLNNYNRFITLLRKALTVEKGKRKRWTAMADRSSH